MKKLLAILALACAGTHVAAQGVNADCINAINLCNTPSFTFFATSGPGNVIDFTSSSSHSVSNPVNNPFPPNFGCLKSGELNPQWLLLTVGNTGTLEFVFGAKNSSNPQAGCYDWSMWPYNPNTCQAIFNNTLAPVRCNWNGTCQNGTGLASKTRIAAMQWDSSNFEPPLQVNACDQYIICISNYSGVNTLVSFESVGTASIACTAGSYYSICHGQSTSIAPVNCSGFNNPTFSLQPGALTSSNGTFVVTPSVTTSYTAYITGNNPNNNNAVETVTALTTVTVNQQPAIAPTVTNSTCKDSSNAFNLNLTLAPLSGNSTYTVNYSPQPAGTNQYSTASNPSVPVAPGVYNVTVTAGGGCSTTGSFAVSATPQPPVFGLSPPGPVYSVTCQQPTVTITALVPAYNYTWTNGLIAQQTGSVANIDFTGPGVWTVTALNPVSGCVDSKTIMVGVNTTPPSSALSPTFQNITCTLTSVLTITASAVTPTVNFSHLILSPLGGTVTGSGLNMHYTPGGVGTFTHFLVNSVNGCRVSKTFTVTSNQGFPTFELTSPQNFSLGCNSRSVATIAILNAKDTPTSAGAVSYTLLTPGSGSATSSGTLSTISVYNVSVPGTYTVITKNNTNYCETRTPVSILSNTLPPGIDSIIVPTTILSCYTPTITLRGISYSPNVNYRWRLPQNATQAGDTLTVSADIAKPTQTLLATYTLVVEDNSSTCINTQTVVMAQNIFPPLARVSSTGSLTCKVQMVVLSNSSTWGSGNPFPKPLPVIAERWEGPSPQVPLEFSTTYEAYQAGSYTMTGRDLNNGCTATTVHVVKEDREYPVVNNPIVPPPDTLDCGAKDAKVSPIISSPTTALSYSWTAPPVATLSGVGTGTLTTNMVGDYRVLVTNTINGCRSGADMKVVNGTLTADFEPSVYSGYAPLPVTFTNNSSSSLGSASISSVWSFGNGTDTTLGEVIPVKAIYLQPGRYKVTMYAGKGECLDTVTKYIEVEIPSGLEIPNVFTPNNDGVNDEFFLRTANLAEIRMVIYDRWGGKVYELTSQTGNVLWDGKDQRGRTMAEGSYFYILTATGKDGKSFEEKGTISLLR